MRTAGEALGLSVDRLAVVARLLVDPTCRRHGVGRALLETAAGEAMARGLRPVLDVAVDFGAAIRLYETNGWTRAGQVTYRFSDGAPLDEFVYLGPSGPTSVTPGSA
jgi:ribosomal protein S18 acetylase RimI-like enzyme